MKCNESPCLKFITMLVHKRSLYFIVIVGLLRGFELVECKTSDCKESEKDLFHVSYKQYPQKKTWTDAQAYCSDCNQTLIDFSDINDLQYVRKKFSTSHSDIWIGLKKDGSNLTEFTANVSRHSFRNVSCAEELLPFFCMKIGQEWNNSYCEDHWRKHDTNCFLPVHNRLNFFGALAHCRKMESRLDAGNLSQALLSSIFKKNTTSIWTGKLYETIHYGRDANWTWPNGIVFEEWDRWQIIFTDIACYGCGFWKNGIIYLTSNCSQRISYLCEKDRGRINSSSLIQRPLKSWKEANNSCGGLLQLSKRDDNLTDALLNSSTTKSIVQRNISYWLGLRKDEKCQKENFKQRLSNISQIEMEKCRYIKNSRANFGNCDQQNHAICVKQVTSFKCSNNWHLTTTESCWRTFKKVTMTWLAAYHFCSTQGSRLANLPEVQAINDSSILRDGRKYWIGFSDIPNDPLHGWYWSNGSPLNVKQRWGLDGKVRHTAGKEKCAFIRNQKDGVFWHNSTCDSPRSFICKKIKFCNFLFRVVDSRIEETLNEKINEFLKLLKRHHLQESFNCLGVSNEVLVRKTPLKCLHKWEENRSSIPKTAIRKKCEEKPECVVTGVEIYLKNITINPSGNSSDISDIIILEYIANDQRISKLEKNETVSLKFRNKKGLDTKVVCCFLNESGLWSSKGMESGLVGKETAECVTDHLSAFTVVLNRKMVSKPHKFALKLINYIGSGLSLAGLLFSCAVYAALYKDLLILTTARHLVHLNLQIALGLTQITFLAGGSPTEYEAACKVIAIMVHYFSLASFSWMLLEAVMLYLKLIAVYGGEFLRIRNFLLFGWGVPLLLVGLSAGVKLDAYGTPQWCWLSDKDGFTWVFFAPVIIVTLTNLVVIIAVVRVLFLASKSGGSDVKKNIISAARGVVILFPTLGLSWGFSVIAVNHDALIWKYLFAIFTSLQGFLIFVIYGVCNREIRVAVGRKLWYNIHPVTSST